MKISWEPFSFLSILFVRLNNSTTTRPTTHCRRHHHHRRHYVNVFTAFALLFAQQCFTHDLATDKLDDNNVNVTATATAAQAKWLNDNRSYGIPAALDAKAPIFKRQSPTKLSNSSSSSAPASRMSTRINHGTTTMASVPLSSTSRSDYHHHHQQANRPTATSRGEHSRVASFSSPPPLPPLQHQPTPQPLSLSSKQQQQHQERQPSHLSHMNLVTTNAPVSHVLILIQTKKNIELNLVRDQFHQFTDMVGVKLENITIDFDVIDGKCELSLSPFPPHFVPSLSFSRFFFCSFFCSIFLHSLS